ncbi:hypothetical protein [Streptomyces beijiangensis]|uniref:Gram-positive cocci surface proteins LPxTG domain-containing protein n=1 Tax=Streptomyces beijiangensis TaxID=163361 RepID=A0A939F289_9ACTN|nr:hypothetical protein [Streptomyces beijiangensis]MBO0510428.1 hypothetical protein [Streptomyces beijiangensis]
MRSIRYALPAAAALTVALGFGAPIAHAAPQASAACDTATTKANQAQADSDAAAADLKKQEEAGGHPGKAEEDNAASLANAAALATTDAQRVCGNTSPVGPMKTGVGSTSEGSNAASLATGAGLVGAAGIGVMALRRRRADSQV